MATPTMRLILFSLLTLGSSAIVKDPETLIINDKDEHVLEIETSTTTEWLILLPYSFKLFIEIDYVNVYTKYGDYLLIKRGPKFDDPGTGLVLTENGYPQKKSFLVSSDTIYIRLFIGGLTPLSTNIQRKFKLKYKASGTGIITTTESPTSPSTWPSPGPNDKIHYRAHLQGLSDVDFANSSFNVYRLKTAIAKMADAYCKAQLFPVKQKIGARNVIISDLYRCPFPWPNSDKCVIVNFAVPVVLEDSYQGYQLLAKHLEIMWQRYEEYLRNIGLSNYKIQDLESNLIGWKAIIGLIVSGFIVVIMIIAFLIEFRPGTFNCFRRQTPEDDQAVIVEEEVEENYVCNEEEYDKFNFRASDPPNNHGTSRHAEFAE